MAYQRLNRLPAVKVGYCHEMIGNIKILSAFTKVIHYCHLPLILLQIKEITIKGGKKYIRVLHLLFSVDMFEEEKLLIVM